MQQQYIAVYIVMSVYSTTVSFVRHITYSTHIYSIIIVFAMEFSTYVCVITGANKHISTILL